MLSRLDAFVVVFGSVIAALTVVAVGYAVFFKREFSWPEAGLVGADEEEDLIRLNEGVPLIVPGSTRWMQVFHDQASTYRGRCFVLADTSDRNSRSLAYDLSAIGFDVDMCDDHEVVMGAYSDRPDDCPWSLLVADLDFMSEEIGVDAVVDDLLVLRHSLKKLNVILVSGCVQRDEADTDRLAVADVTLRTPVSLKRLREGVWDAQSNNMIWQGRAQLGRVVAAIPDDGSGGVGWPAGSKRGLKVVSGKSANSNQNVDSGDRPAERVQEFGINLAGQE